MKHLKKLFLVSALLVHAQGQPVEVVKVTAKNLSRIVKLPGEFLPYESVSLHARAAGYVEEVLVDRGSVVKQGQLLVKLSAPEMAAQVAAAEARVQEADAQRVESEAQLASAQSRFDKLKKADAWNLACYRLPARRGKGEYNFPGRPHHATHSALHRQPVCRARLGTVPA